MESFFLAVDFSFFPSFSILSMKERVWMVSFPFRFIRLVQQKCQDSNDELLRQPSTDTYILINLNCLEWAAAAAAARKYKFKNPAEKRRLDH